MFVVRKLFNSVLGTTANPELISLPSGRLFLIRPNQTLKTGKECIFIDAAISIRRTPVEHQYQLVVTRAFGEGEEELLEENAENESERPFLIDEIIRFVVSDTSPEPGEPPVPTFSWSDTVSGDPDDRFEFALDPESCPADRIAFFEGLVYRCMWERKYKKDSSEAEDDELEAFRVEPQGASTTSARNLFRAPSPDSEDDEVAAQLGNLSVSSAGAAAATPVGKGKGKARAETPASASSRGASVEPIESAQVSPGDVRSDADLAPDRDELTAIWSQESQLYLFDQSVYTFIQQDAKVQATLWLPKKKGELAWLTVLSGPEKGEKVWVGTNVSAEQNISFKEPELSMTFNYTYDRGDGSARLTYTWLLRFPGQQEFEQAREAFTSALFEQNFGKGAWSKLKDDERRYNREAYEEDIEMFDAEEERRLEEEEVREREREEREAEEQEDSSEEESSEEEDSSEEAAKFRSPRTKGLSNRPKGPQNSQLAVGYKGDLSFVVRGDMIGIFQSQGTGAKKLKFMTSIQGVTTPDGKKAFEPTKIMLHDQDTTMVLKNPHNPNSLFRLDLGTGRVVDEWKISDSIEVANFLPKTKFAQMDPEQTFIGTSHNGIFRIDPRLAGAKLVDSEFKQYATKADFSASATTESGRLAVASNKGDIRLYDKIGKIAKTALPALGDPIIGVDVSADGRHIVATTKTYLLFIDTLITEGQYKGQLGFDRSFPAAAKPKPMRLMLKQEHAAFMQHQISFTPAKFNQGPNEPEKSIVTSTGPYIVAFNVRRLLQGRVDYTIKRYGADVVADNFRFGNDRDIIALFSGDVVQEDKRRLERPTRESLTSAELAARRGSGIVKTF